MDWRTIPSLSALRAFEAMARLGGFSAAARELNVTHAAIAQHIRYLEDFLTVKLAFREGRGMRLTASGRALSEALKDGFQTIATGIQTLQEDRDQQPLRITLTPAFAENWLMPRLGEFWAAHPDIELSLNPSTKVIDLTSNGFDLAIRFGKGDWPDLQMERLVGAGFMIIGSPDMIKRLSSHNPEGLMSAPWLLESHHTEPELILKTQGLDLGKSKITRFFTNSLVLAAARSGLGLAVQAESLTENDIKSGQLACVQRIHSENHGYYLVSTKTKPTAKLMIFVEWLKRSL